MDFLTHLAATPPWIWLVLLVGVGLLMTAFHDWGAPRQTAEAVPPSTPVTVTEAEDEILEAEVLEEPKAISA